MVSAEFGVDAVEERADEGNLPGIAGEGAFAGPVGDCELPLLVLTWAYSSDDAYADRRPLLLRRG